MYCLKVNGNTYKVTYTYRILAKTDILDKIQAVLGSEGEGGLNGVKETLAFIPELLLYGLQKFHKEQFGFADDEEFEQKLDSVYDIIEQYEEDHSTDDVAEGEAKPDAFSLMNDLIEELKTQGFFARLSAQGATTAETENTTVVPMDHQKKTTKKKVGAKA